MKKDVAEKWVMALRSGKYKQGKNSLRTNDTYCCLGVLCEVLGLEAQKMGKDASGQHYAYEGAGGLLPYRAQEMSGMKDRGGKIGSSHLTYHNDYGATFAEIADLIEANVDTL